MKITPAIVHAVKSAVNRQRLIDTAVRLIAAPSWTGEAEKACDCLDQILSSDGWEVDRPAAGHPRSSAVVTHLKSSRPGRILQFNGHLDTVHLPFVEPKVNGDLMSGSGASDMKGGIAAAVEALRVLRDTNTLPAGSVMLTAFQPTADSPDTMSDSLSIIKNGARCGSRRLTCSTSSGPGGGPCSALSFIGGPFALPRQLCDQRRFFVPFPNGARRDAAIIAAAFDVPRNAR